MDTHWFMIFNYIRCVEALPYIVPAEIDLRTKCSCIYTQTYDNASKDDSETQSSTAVMT
jgi:hypothetical protein